MSGDGGSQDCRMCGGYMQYYSDHKTGQTDEECFDCGWQLYTVINWRTLEEINEIRKFFNEENELSEDDEEYLHPLTKEQYDAIKRWGL